MNWHSTRLKYLCTDAGQYGLNLSAEQYMDSGTRLIRTSDIAESGSLSPAADGVHVDLPLEPRFILQTGDLLLSRSGTLGRSLLVPELAEPTTFAGYLIRFRPLPQVDPRFLAYSAMSEPFQNAIRADAVVSTIQNFNAERYANICLTVPAREEQRRIADFLDAECSRVAKLVSSRKRMVELVSVRRWSLLEDLIEATQAPNIPVRRMLRSIIDGPFGSAFSSSDYTDEGAAVVRLGNIGFDEYRPVNQARIPLDLYRNFLQHRVSRGDVLIAGLGDAKNHAGRACVAPALGEAIVKGKCFCVRIDENVVLGRYLSMVLSSPRGEQSLETRGSTRAMINLEIVKAADLPLPSLHNQRLIVRGMEIYGTSEQRAVNALEREIELLTERRQALITAAVTGQIDVTTARGIEV